MRGRRRLVGEPEPSVPDDALGQLEAHDLRELIRELLLEVDGGVRGRVLDRVAALAVGKGSGCAPEGLARVACLADLRSRMGKGEAACLAIALGYEDVNDHDRLRLEHERTGESAKGHS